MKERNADKPVIIFLLLWLLVNLFQAAFTELHDDEAYYWLYAQFLDWGYFDHPPMVALFIDAGTSLFHSKLSLRLFTVISNTLAVYLLWQLASAYSVKPRLFILLFSSIVLFHVYSFITTPDSPLFFFTVSFFLLFRKYLEQDSYKLAVALGMIIALMLYSKYHAVLVIFFSLLPNLKLLKRPSLWLAAGAAFVLFLPHIFWQISNDYPSVQFHLIDRSARPYRFSFTTDFLLGQLAIAGPLTGWWLYYRVFRLKTDHPFLRTLKMNFIGILAFFFLSTFKGSVEAHWTLLAFIPFFLLSAISLARMQQIPAWFHRLAVVGIALVILVRILFVLPVPALGKLPALRNFYGNGGWAKAIQEKAGNSYVVMDGGFQRASVYDFYNQTTRGFAYDSRDYRKTQFDRWPIEDSLRHQRVYYVTGGSHGIPEEDTISTVRGHYHGRWLEDVRMYQKLEIRAEGLDRRPAAGAVQDMELHIHNPYADTIHFSNNGAHWKCFIEYGYTTQVYEAGRYRLIDGDYEKLRIPPGETIALPVRIKAPESTGKYMLIFSVRTEPFPGARNSPKYTIEVP